MYKVIFFVLLVVISSCKKKQTEEKIVVAKVYDKYLYLSDIQQIFPENITKEDSLAIANAYINTWIKNQLIVNKAELNLTLDQLDIDNQIEAYRASLLIHKYEEQMINQKLDTIVTEDEIEKYYHDNTANFVLDENLVKALYVKLSKSAPNIDDVKKWYKSEQREEIKKLDSYSFNYAAKYDYFNDEWVSFDVIKNELPLAIENDEEFLKTNKFIEQSDTGFYYFVYIKEHISKGSVSPFVSVKDKVKDIILNRRKIKFLSDLENEIFNNALDNKDFVIYNLDKKN